MQLLSPDQITKDTSERLEEQRSITADAAIEETRIMKKLNDAREFAEREMADMEQQAAAKKAQLLSEIEPLRNEVVSLEKRKEEALKPIHDMEERARTAMVEAETRLGEVIKREVAVTAREDECDARIEKIADAEEDIAQRREAIFKKEEGLAHAEILSKSQQGDLANKWVAYYKAVEIHETSLKEKHLRIEMREKACETREQQIAEKEAEQNDREHVLNNKYADLQAAVARTQ